MRTSALIAVPTILIGVILIQGFANYRFQIQAIGYYCPHVINLYYTCYHVGVQSVEHYFDHVYLPYTCKNTCTIDIAAVGKDWFYECNKHVKSWLMQC